MKTINPFMGLALCGIAAQAQEKPNFLIIQCDHLTQRVVGAYGHTQDCTLPIDEVASRGCLLYTSPSPRDRQKTRMPSSA